MLMDPGDLDPVGLAGSSLRLPSGFASPDGYAHFIRGAANATCMQAPGLKTMSGVVPRMQVGFVAVCLYRLHPKHCTAHAAREQTFPDSASF